MSSRARGKTAGKRSRRGAAAPARERGGAMPKPGQLMPMEARTVDDIPPGNGWQYEPKWDGFRCLAFRNGDEVELMSKAGKPLSRYFPEVVESLRELEPERFILDGELVVPVKGRISFDALLLRIHPAASRVNRLAAETPAMLIAFDLLADEHGRSLVNLPLSERRPELERFAAEFLKRRAMIRLSPATTRESTVRGWFRELAEGLDGVIAKRLDQPYRAGEREGMVKVKRMRTAECVVGGFRYSSRRRVVGSLLLGLYDDDELLHHVGFASNIPRDERAELTRRLERLHGQGFTGRAPGGPSRWSTERSSEWEPLRHELVVEVQYDHFSGGRFRHGTSFLRWRPDKPPRQCRLEQVERESQPSLALLGGTTRRSSGSAAGAGRPRTAPKATSGRSRARRSR